MNAAAAAEVSALLKQLIGCRSVTPADGGALDLAAEVLRGAGFSVRRLPCGDVDNLWAADCDAPTLLFAGHIDVVPPGDLSAWSGDPFVAEERGGYIYGRGAADMKSGAAAMICAACRLRRAGIGGVAVLLTSDEEGEAIHGTRHVAELRKRENAPMIPFVIVGEPTCDEAFGDTIKIGRRGSLTARIVVRGVQTHAAYPRDGGNPIHLLHSALSEVFRRFAELRRDSDSKRAQKSGEEAAKTDSLSPDDFPPPGMQIVKIASGVAENVVPASAAATVNFRYTPGENADDLRRLTEESLQTAAADRWECEWRHGASPFVSAPGALVAALRESIFSACGRRAKLSAGGGTSDGRFLREIAGELAEFGVVGETMHEPDERVAVDSPPMLSQIYEQTARKLLADGN
ncbi:MAG: M20/M25/M40 family metallo-hydrolase [Gammaproteobacteria bacterium]